jgi:hypothetical protein
VLRGDDGPKDAHEPLEFAILSCQTRQFGPSARLFAAAFQAAPKLAEDMRGKYR